MPTYSMLIRPEELTTSDEAEDSSLFEFEQVEESTSSPLVTFIQQVKDFHWSSGREKAVKRRWLIDCINAQTDLTFIDAFLEELLRSPKQSRIDDAIDVLSHTHPEGLFRRFIGEEDEDCKYALVLAWARAIRDPLERLGKLSILYQTDPSTAVKEAIVFSGGETSGGEPFLREIAGNDSSPVIRELAQEELEELGT